VAGVLADHGVSIEAMRQAPDEPYADVPDGRAAVLLTTHAAREASLAATVAALRSTDRVHEITSVLRVEGV
jgi:homoserine dehydrogenase